MTRVARRTTTGLVLAGLVASALIACTGLGGLSGPTQVLDASAPPADEAGLDGTTPIEAATCLADVTSDPKNCGRCGHDCIGGRCEAGMCTPVAIASLGNAPLNALLLSGDTLFVSSRVATAIDTGGLWRIPLSGGAAELYAPLHYAEGMAIVGSTLYFGVNDLPVDGMGHTGGLYSCPIVGPAPCAPTLVVAANSIVGIGADQSSVFYPDLFGGIMRYVPGQAPTLYSSGGGGSNNLLVDGTSMFMTYASLGTGMRNAAYIAEVTPDGGINDLGRYDNANADDGQLTADRDAVFFVAYDVQVTSGGIVRRYPRTAGETPCDYGGSSNARPYAVHVDADHTFWTNQGGGATKPYAMGNVVSCPRKGCCSKPDVLWAGGATPSAITGDATALYFATRGTGYVYRLAKP